MVQDYVPPPPRLKQPNKERYNNMATATIQQKITKVLLTLNGDEYIALRNYIGKSSKNDLKSKGLTDLQCELISSLFFTLKQTGE